MKKSTCGILSALLVAVMAVSGCQGELKRSAEKPAKRPPVAEVPEKPVTPEQPEQPVETRPKYIKIKAFKEALSLVGSESNQPDATFTCAGLTDTNAIDSLAKYSAAEADENNYKLIEVPRGTAARCTASHLGSTLNCLVPKDTPEMAEVDCTPSSHRLDIFLRNAYAAVDGPRAGDAVAEAYFALHNALRRDKDIDDAVVAANAVTEAQNLAFAQENWALYTAVHPNNVARGFVKSCGANDRMTYSGTIAVDDTVCNNGYPLTLDALGQIKTMQTKSMVAHWTFNGNSALAITGDSIKKIKIDGVDVGSQMEYKQNSSLNPNIDIKVQQFCGYNEFALDDSDLPSLQNNLVFYTASFKNKSTSSSVDLSETTTKLTLTGTENITIIADAATGVLVSGDTQAISTDAQHAIWESGGEYYAGGCLGDPDNFDIVFVNDTSSGGTADAIEFRRQSDITLGEKDEAADNPDQLGMACWTMMLRPLADDADAISLMTDSFNSMHKTGLNVASNRTERAGTDLSVALQTQVRNFPAALDLSLANFDSDFCEMAVQDPDMLSGISVSVPALVMIPEAQYEVTRGNGDSCGGARSHYVYGGFQAGSTSNAPGAQNFDIGAAGFLNVCFNTKKSTYDHGLIVLPIGEPAAE